MFNNSFMKLAFEHSLKCLKSEDIPVGCIIINKDNKIIAREKNEVYKKNDICNHAEILAIKSASKKLQSKLLNDCSIYVTLEPCAMCAYAICMARIKNLYIGLLEPKTGAVISNINIFNSKVANNKPEIFYGFMEDEISKLIKDFFRKRRN